MPPLSRNDVSRIRLASLLLDTPARTEVAAQEYANYLGRPLQVRWND